MSERAAPSSELALAGVHVLLCATGSVAAIKAGELLAQLQRKGAECQLAASDTGAVFLAHSQQPLPDNVPLLQAEAAHSSEVCTASNVYDRRKRVGACAVHDILSRIGCLRYLSL